MDDNYVGLGTIRDPKTASRITWTSKEMDLFFELLKTKKHDLVYIAKAMNKSFMIVNAYVQHLEAMSQRVAPMNSQEIPFAYEVPETFDLEYDPVPESEQEESLEAKAESDLFLFNSQSHKLLQIWSDMAQIEYTPYMAELLHAKAIEYIRAIVTAIVTKSRKSLVTEWEVASEIKTVPGISIDWQSLERNMKHVSGSSNREGEDLSVDSGAHVYSQPVDPEPTEEPSNETIEEDIDEYMTTYMNNDLQKQYFAIPKIPRVDQRPYPPPLNWNQREIREFERGEMQDDMLEHHDNEATSEYIIATAEKAKTYMTKLQSYYKEYAKPSAASKTKRNYSAYFRKGQTKEPVGDQEQVCFGCGTVTKRSNLRKGPTGLKTLCMACTVWRARFKKATGIDPTLEFIVQNRKPETRYMRYNKAVKRRKVHQDDTEIEFSTDDQSEQDSETSSTSTTSTSSE